MPRNPATRAPFVIAAAVSAFPLLALGSADATGDAWRWLEYPRHMTVFAILVGLVAMFRRRPALAIATPFLVAGLAFAWEFIGEWRGLAKFGKTDLVWTEMHVLALYAFERVAPWLVGALFGILAAVAVTRSRDDKTNVLRAGLWLVGVAAVAAAFTFANEGWISHEGNNTIHDFSDWPGPKKLSLTAAIIAAVAGAIAIGWSRRRSPPIPEARVHRG